ncbi:MAG: 4Fe-4S binding protein [Proteobacteria bacterium]|nr:4Fe-4S binding protein [Pseudomonadota bacterium]MBU1739780.1 4Fe-4S binding protein [Pseudomonadota bacterium]
MLSGLLFDRIAPMSKPAVSLQPRRCLRARFRGSECLACVEDCPSGALTLNGRTISFAEEKCSGCLRCTAICPNDALTDDLDLEMLLESVTVRRIAVLSCSKGRQSEGKIKIPCLGFLSESLLAAISTLAGGDVLLDVEPCADCVNGHCLPLIKKRLSNIRDRASDHLHVKIRLAFTKDDLPGIDRGTARRFFLKYASEAIVNIPDKTPSAASGQAKLPTRNSLGLQVALGKATEPDEKEFLKSFLYELKISENCDHCPLCSGMCPTGALKRTKTEKSKQLVFINSRCSGCGICVGFCKKNALTLLPGNKRS